MCIPYFIEYHNNIDDIDLSFATLDILVYHFYLGWTPNGSCNGFRIDFIKALVGNSCVFGLHVNGHMFIPHTSLILANI